MKKLAVLLVLAATAHLLVPTGVAAYMRTAVPESRAQINLSFAPLVKRVAPAVVNIYTKRLETARRAPMFDDPFFRRFFERFPFSQRRQVQNSLGSGVIVRPQGLIVTNHHVIEKADEITVALSDRREFDARVVLRDESTDLAILRIDVRGERLPHLELRDSDTLEVGDLVLAIGNPFGLGQTVTSGIVSATARAARGMADLGFFIQTDAAINLGNSGGALVGLDGKLVGINTAIFSQAGGFSGIGFAIPSNMVATVIGGAVGGGKVVRPWLGVRGQEIDSDLARGMGLERPGGIVLNWVHPRSPARRAGMQVGDVVVSMDGRSISNLAELRFRVATRRIGSYVRFGLIRNGREENLTLRLEGPSAYPSADRTLIVGHNPAAGSEVGNLSPVLAQELSMDPEKTGVVVLRIEPRSHAESIGLKEKDILVSVNGSRVETVDQLQSLLAVERVLWRMEVEREGRVLSVTIQG